MNRLLFFIFPVFLFSCSNEKNEMKIEKIPNVEIITGTKSKIDYFEVFDYESYTDKEVLQKIKEYCKINKCLDSLYQYDEYQCYFYKHTKSVNYSSFVGKNTSNFEEGGIRDWDNPRFYNMNSYLISKVYFDKINTNYIIYKHGNIVLDETEAVNKEK